MSTTVKAKGDFKQVPAGTHPAYCYAVIDIGRQESHYGVKSQLILSFEFPHELVEYEGEQRPMVMSALHQVTPENRQGQALALRLMTINASSVGMPLLFGAASAALGSGPEFWIMATSVTLGSRLARKI